MFRQIVVGVDGREGGRDAVALAKLLVAADGELTLAHVFPGDAHAYRGASAAHEASERERAEALLETSSSASSRCWGCQNREQCAPGL
jgi:nucleotide-binding universal stress UspA family protein